MKTLAPDSIRDGQCLCVYPRDGLCSTPVCGPYWSQRSWRVLLHWLCAQMKFKLWSGHYTVKWHPWKENMSERSTDQSFSAEQNLRIYTYPRSQQSGLRRVHGFMSDRRRPGESSQHSHLLARCAHWHHSGWLSGLVSENTVNQWHWELSLHQIVSSAPAHHCTHGMSLPTHELLNFTGLNQALRTH